MYPSPPPQRLVGEAPGGDAHPPRSSAVGVAAVGVAVVVVVVVVVAVVAAASAASVAAVAGEGAAAVKKHSSVWTT